ncbi:MAG: 50S ribosomal protein L9, partial [Bacteroidetes bacterium]|nr:50S ribosomal protein L9 [Bacteroidota bacterium]
MKVILRENFNALGKIGDIVDVKDGYARNFLIPKNIVYVATDGNLKALEEEKKRFGQKIQKEQKSAEKLSVELEKISVSIPVQVGEEDKIFGTVTTQMISEALSEKGFQIDKRKIEIEEQIKTLGIYNVLVKLHPDINTKVKVWVV